jgi:hypothetical protein
VRARCVVEEDAHPSPVRMRGAVSAALSRARERAQ